MDRWRGQNAHRLHQNTWRKKMVQCCKEIRWEKNHHKTEIPSWDFGLIIQWKFCVCVCVCGGIYIWNVVKFILFCWIQVLRGVEIAAGFGGWIIWGLISRGVTYHQLKRTSLLGFTGSWATGLSCSLSISFYLCNFFFYWREQQFDSINALVLIVLLSYFYI